MARRPGQSVLIFSASSAYCNQLVSMVRSAQLEAQIRLLCLDTTRVALPPSIRVVPTLVTHDRRLLTDGDVRRYVEFIASISRGQSSTSAQSPPGRGPPSSQQDPAEFNTGGGGEVGPAAGGGPTGGSVAYSYLDGADDGGGPIDPVDLPHERTPRSSDGELMAMQQRRDAELRGLFP
jgi:hypothetical protein